MATRSPSRRLRPARTRARRDVQSGQPLPPRHARAVDDGWAARADRRGRRGRRRRQRSRRPSRSSARARSSRATIRPTSRSRSRSIRTRAASTAASTATRGRRTPISTCRPGSTSRRSCSRSPTPPSCCARSSRSPATSAIRSRSAPTPIPTSRSSANGRSRARCSRCSPSTSIRSRSSPSRALVERDIDIIAPMAAKSMARVYLSITTLDRELARKLEPRAAAPHRRLQAMRTLADAGIPVGVMVAPIIPQLNDRDLEAILEAAAAHGAHARGLGDAAPAARSRAAVPRMARRALPAARRARDEPRAADCAAAATTTPQFGTRMRGTGEFADADREALRARVPALRPQSGAVAARSLAGTRPRQARYVAVPAAARSRAATRSVLTRLARARHAFRRRP